MVRSCSNFGVGHVQAELSNGNQVVLPAWMLDEEVCKEMSIREQPIIAVEALLTLRSLLDSQALFVAPDSTTSGASSIPGSPVESAKTKSVAVRHPKTRTS